MEADIITTLPQNLIETILCLIPLDEAARTSILSKEWRYKWTKIPKLVFSLPWGPWVCQMMETSKLFPAINQVMLLRQAPIQEFTLFIDEGRHSLCSYEIDQIILHLSRYHKVKCLTLRFEHESKDGSSYSLPLSFFPLHHLTDLELGWCTLDYQPTFNGFGSLTSLTLDCVSVSIKTLLHLISSSPIKSFSLHMLAQNIIGLEKSTMIELFESLPVIEQLSIWRNVIPWWFVHDLVPQELLTSLTHLKYFHMDQMTFHDGYGLTFLAVLIKSSPNLEKIELEIDPDHYLGDGIVDEDVYEEYHSNVWLEHISDVRLEHLNELKIMWFTNLEVELEFVKFILSKSPKLKKVSIKTYCFKKDQKLDVFETLLRAPRASMVEIDVV